MSPEEQIQLKAWLFLPFVAGILIPMILSRKGELKINRWNIPQRCQTLRAYYRLSRLTMLLTPPILGLAWYFYLPDPTTALIELYFFLFAPVLLYWGYVYATVVRVLMTKPTSTLARQVRDLSKKTESPNRN